MFQFFSRFGPKSSCWRCTSRCCLHGWLPTDMCTCMWCILLWRRPRIRADHLCACPNGTRATTTSNAQLCRRMSLNMCTRLHTNVLFRPEKMVGEEGQGSNQKQSAPRQQIGTTTILNTDSVSNEHIQKELQLYWELGICLSWKSNLVSSGTRFLIFEVLSMLWTKGHTCSRVSREL